MRDILISSTVCVLCLLLALVSQLVAPSTVTAAPSNAATTAMVRSSAPESATRPTFELDPDDPNPTLFAMAPDQSSADASALGGPLESADTRVTSSGLTITDLTLGEGAEAAAGETVVVHYRGTLENGKQFDASYDRVTPFSFPLGAGQVLRLEVIRPENQQFLLGLLSLFLLDGHVAAEGVVVSSQGGGVTGGRGFHRLQLFGHRQHRFGSHAGRSGVVDTTGTIAVRFHGSGGQRVDESG